MDIAAYLGSVGAIAGLALGAMYFVVGLLGRRFDDRFDSIDRRFDDWIAGADKRFDRVDTRFDGLDTRFDGLDTRFDGVDTRFDGVDRRLDRLETQNESIIGAVADLGQRVTRLESRWTG